MINLTIYSHSHLLSEGLKKLLEDEPGINITLPRGNPASKTKASIGTDVILADLDAFFNNSNELFKKGNARILLISNTSRMPSINNQLPELIAMGVAGILPPETDTPLLKRALRAVASGELWINHKTIKEMFFAPRQQSPLTRQEGQIVQYICKGFRNKEIAKTLDISEQTVKSHCNRIFRKFGVSDRLQLALMIVHDQSAVKIQEP